MNGDNFRSLPVVGLRERVHLGSIVDRRALVLETDEDMGKEYLNLCPRVGSTEL